ncbi:thiocillin family RiPP [Streptomyces sp. 8N114]|uniref:thiocillin family RiPP n=1 Tax=Streptomyces sp. 8N114 TaxID=3457419 RepID=UPI003FCF1B67
MDSTIDLELWAEDLEVEALPESNSPFTTYACAGTAACGSCPVGSAGTFGCLSSNGG